MYTTIRVDSKEAKKEPAVVTAEKIMISLKTGEMSPVIKALDPGVLIDCPMGVFSSRKFVQAWLEFDSEVVKPYRAAIKYPGTTPIGDGMKAATTQWSIGGLHFTDVIQQTPLLTIRKIDRTMRLECKCQEDYEIAQELLLAWTGPYFSKFCSPKKLGVDNRALILPILDFSFKNIKEVRYLFGVTPAEGKPLADAAIFFHFVASQLQQERLAADRLKQQEKQLDETGNKQQFEAKREVTIKAKNREGEENALVVDLNVLEAKKATNELEPLDDGNPMRDRDRYVCSGLRLANNELTNARDLQRFIKVTLVNAFYFLNIIDLSRNKITEIPDLSQFPIQTLYLHDNRIEDWNELKKLSSLPQLQSLTLFGNPLQQFAESTKLYRLYVLMQFYHPDGILVFGPSTPKREGARASSPSRDGSAAKTPARATGNTVKMHLKQLDHAVVSPLEVETLGQQLLQSKYRRSMRRVKSPPPAARSPSPKPS
jgi:hypothetical protein